MLSTSKSSSPSLFKSPSRIKPSTCTTGSVFAIYRLQSHRRCTQQHQSLWIQTQLIKKLPLDQTCGYDLAYSAHYAAPVCQCTLKDTELACGYAWCSHRRRLRQTHWKQRVGCRSRSDPQCAWPTNKGICREPHSHHEVSWMQRDCLLREIDRPSRTAWAGIIWYERLCFALVRLL